MHVWNYDTQKLVKSFEVCDVPVRAARFVHRKNWIVTGSDDMQVRVFNYNTQERVHSYDAHSDYIRSIAVHPTQPYILTSSDDMSIKLWNWERSWTCVQVYEGHTHYVMQVVINPKDNNTFASASLDRTIKVWSLGSGQANFTLEGRGEHEKGVNCVDYCHSADKPYLISGADDRLVKVWDYQTKTCVQTLEGHAQNVTAVSCHPELPIIMTGSEDGTVRIWHLNTYRLENTLNYGLERVWTINCLKGSNRVALGFDEGSVVVKLGREEPAISMDGSGKIVWARHSELQQANLKALPTGEELRDGQVLPLSTKDMGSCEIYPQAIHHNSNGRFVVVCGDGEYIIYTALTLRNKSFGPAHEFVWALDSSEYAIRENSVQVKIFKNFKERTSFKPEFGAEGIYGGFMLGVRSAAGLAFYEWDSLELVRRIEVQAKNVYWSENGSLLSICTEDSFYILRYSPENVTAAKEDRSLVTEDGIEDAFDVISEVNEVVKTGLWIGDCFIFTNGSNRLNYCVGSEIVTVAHMDKPMYLIGYIPKDNRLYLADKELNIVSYSLLLPVLDYQTAVMRSDFQTADKILPSIPKEQRTRVAHFLEKQGFKVQALAVSTDPEHRFDLALQLKDTKTALELAEEAQSEQKWRLLADLAINSCDFELAQECLVKANDFAGQLLLATSSGDAEMLRQLADSARENNVFNVAFLSHFILADKEKALDILLETNRVAEAAFFARTYLPSRVSEIVKLWKEKLAQHDSKAAQALADPAEYENLFPDFQESLRLEQIWQANEKRVPASSYKISTSASHTSDSYHSEHSDPSERSERSDEQSDAENVVESD